MYLVLAPAVTWGGRDTPAIRSGEDLGLGLSLVGPAGPGLERRTHCPTERAARLEVETRRGM